MGTMKKSKVVCINYDNEWIVRNVKVKKDVNSQIGHISETGIEYF